MVECPVCRASNPPGTITCPRCSTSLDLDGATIPSGRPASIPVPSDPPLAKPDAETLYAAAGATGWSVPIQKRAERLTTDEPQAGDVLGERYEILDRLGQGGMGAVYKARDRELDRLVALKMIRPDLAGNPEVLRRFKQELILARQVTHKNIIRIFDFGMADGRKFITMDYVEGRDLKSLLVERGKLPVAEAIHILQQICRGLEAAHGEGVIHRDLKPQNIMLDGSGRVLVMDFGLARSLEAVGMTQTGALLGTPDYMSPEQALAKKADARSDLFSLGIIFYEMLTGRLPFEAKTLMAALRKRIEEKAVPPREIAPEIPQDISDVVMKCLEVEAGKRYQTAADILADLETGSRQPNAGMTGSQAVFTGILTAGSQFGPRYRIESVIGEGGMGKVYKAHDSDLNRTVALKMVRNELANDAESMQRFKQELLLASQISHRNILRIHDLGDVGGVKFISMAYVPGKDLHDVIAECGRLPTERFVVIAKQLAAALEAAHAEGVVHRDLKPRNVLVDADDHIYISDFGLAKSLESASSGMTRTGEVMGTPRYMSPEQAESKAVDHRADLYSLGVMLYEMATGLTPFGGESMLQVMYQHVTQAPPNPKETNPELPDYLVGIILRCLEKDPARRYQHASEILHDLESGSAPPTRVVRLRMAETGYPRWLLVLMAGLIALGVILVPVRQLATRLWDSAAGTSNVKQTYLAVLPFRVVGSDPALKELSDGIVDAVTAKLFELKNVYVASSAAAETASKQDSAAKAAKVLGVKQLVQGSIQGAGDKFRVVVSLDDVASQRRLWNAEFNGSRQDVLTIENQIYSKLLAALALKPSTDELSRGATRLTDNVDAYQLYLRARNIMHGQQDLKNVTAALDLYNQAILKDPGFALAYAGVADASRRMYVLKNDPVWSERALGAAEQATVLNDKLPEAHTALGSVYRLTGKTTEAVGELKRALELAPNSDDGYRRLGFAYLAAGQKDQAIQAYRKAVDVNPYYWLNWSHLGGAYFKFGPNEEALRAYQKVTELAPQSDDGYANIGAVYLREGKWTEAIPSLQKALDRRPSASIYSNLGTAYFYLNRYGEAAAMFEKAVALEPDQQVTGNLADAYRWMGQQVKANATYDLAIALALKSFQVNPRDGKTLEYLGLYYAKKGDPKRAQEFIRRARAVDANDNELMYRE